MNILLILHPPFFYILFILSNFFVILCVLCDLARESTLIYLYRYEIASSPSDPCNNTYASSRCKTYRRLKPAATIFPYIECEAFSQAEACGYRFVL